MNNRIDVIKKICDQKGYEVSNYIQIGEGGSGYVCQIRRDDKQFAVKVLSDKKVLPRFEEEIRVTKLLSGCGVIPVCDDGFIDDIAFYIMPKLISLGKFRVENYQQIVFIILSVARTLEKLSSRGVYHRDIKPNNIVIDPKKNTTYLIDLGLVKERFKVSDLTKDQERIGSLTFIAPERIRPKKNSEIDTEKADVYSFGMTAWALITEEKQGFGGQYSQEDNHTSFASRGIDFKGISILESVIKKCTAINPAQRPLFVDICSELSTIESSGRELSDFFANSQFAFRQTKPDFLIWQDSSDIARVLNDVIKRKYPLEILLNSDDGWLNLEKVIASTSYPGMIELYANSELSPPFLMDISYLLLANFEDIPFYLIKAKQLEKFVREKSYDDVFSWFEPVCELEPYRFTYEKCYDYNDFQGENLPKTARPVGLITEGSFLIQLLGNDNAYLDNIWSQKPELLETSFPFYNHALMSEHRKKMQFIEVSKFKSRRRILTTQEQQSIQDILNFVQTIASAGNTRLNENDFTSFFNGRSDVDFLKIVTEIAQYTVNNFITDPFYIPLDDALVQFNRKQRNEEYHIERHPDHGIDFFVKKMKLFLSKYT